MAVTLETLSCKDSQMIEFGEVSFSHWNLLLISKGVHWWHNEGTSKKDVRDFQNDQTDIHDEDTTDQSGTTVLDVNEAPVQNWFWKTRAPLETLPFSDQ